MKQGILGAWVGGLAVVSVLAWSEWRVVAHGQLVHATAHILVAWLATLLGLLLFKQSKLAAIAAGFSLSFLWTWSEPLRAAPAALQTATSNHTDLASLRAVWLNAWGKPQCIQRIREYAVDQQADIVVLCQAAGGPALQALTEVYPYAEYNRKHQIGVWSRLPLQDVQWINLPATGPASSRDWLSLRVQAEAANGEPVALPILVGHVRRPHVPAHAVGMAAIHRLAADAGPQALFADLNTTPWAADFRGLLAADWHDTRAGQWPRRTWREPGFPLWRWPIDYVLTRGSCIATRSEIGPDLGSDHYPLLVDLQFTKS